MSDNHKPKRPKKQPKGDYPIGYARAPEEYRVKKGQVLNPYGRNGKPKREPDTFTRVMSRKTRLKIDGEEIIVTAEEATILRLTIEAQRGNVSAGRAIMAELARRGRFDPPPPTREELEEEAAELEEKKRLSAHLVRLLEEEAERKRTAPSSDDDLPDHEQPSFD